MKTTVLRLEIADAGDMAYEFSNVENSFETTDGKTHSFPNSILRVWRKVDGEWKIAAHLARRHYQEPEKAPGKN
jgi:ketosteroid isomerase-like protein